MVRPLAVKMQKLMRTLFVGHYSHSGVPADCSIPQIRYVLSSVVKYKKYVTIQVVKGYTHRGVIGVSPKKLLFP